VQYPVGLLRRLAAADLIAEELELLDAWMNSEDPVPLAADLLMQLRRIPRAAHPSLLRRIVASLVGQVGPEVALHGARGVGGPQHLTYVAEDIEIEIELSSMGGRGQRVVGRVWGDGQWRSVRLENARGDLEEVAIDEAGIFSFVPVRNPGTIIVRGDSEEVYVYLPAKRDGGA
jgi:hypothetical protein